MAMIFILFTVLAQASVALLARQSAVAAVAAAADAVAVDPTAAAEVEARLAEELAATVPGAVSVEGSVDIGWRVARARARFEFVPPGPMFRTFVMEVRADVPLVAAP